MSTLAMVLMAALAVPGSGPEVVSAETEQRLDLSGKWRGELVWPQGIGMGTRMKDGEFWDGFSATPNGMIRDEGGGILCVTYRGHVYVGVWAWDRDRLLICFRDSLCGVPLSFGADVKGDQHLLSLRRVESGRAKPRK